MEFHPLHAALQLPSLTTITRPDNQVNVAEPAEAYLSHVAADQRFLAARAPAIAPTGSAHGRWIKTVGKAP